MLEVEGLRRPGLGPAGFRLAAGECLAVAGPSGSGKSLLLRAVADLDPAEGRVSLGGTLREAMDGPAWRRRVTYLAAEPGWWDETVAPHFRDWPAQAGRVARLGLRPDIGEARVAVLSTGERQRLALLRALEGGPSVLLADEPTAALDGAGRLAAEALLAEAMAGGMALLLVSHDPGQAARMARRRLVVDKGAVREEAAP
jgi:ABC-type iron transport system FetAB ATPase subunit